MSTAVHASSPAENARFRQLADFVAAQGYDAASVRPLAADASFRRYFRVTRPGRAVVMDAPPDKEPVAPFAAMARHLTALGFSAPHLLAEDREGGFLLLEDLGDTTFTALLHQGRAREADLYALAVDCLVALHRHPDALSLDLPRYSTALLLDEAALFADWYLPALIGRRLGPKARKDYDEAWRGVLEPVQSAPPALVLRDYHVDNLLLLSDRKATARCGLLDFQDAVIGPAAYDLVSLLEDARRDIDEDVRATMLQRYIAAMPVPDIEDFVTQGHVLAAQRHAKVAGIFLRLWLRDGKPGYLRHIPRVIGLLARHLDRPCLAPVAAWLAQWAPAWDTPLADAEILRQGWDSLAPGPGGA